jgi:hypothetical protein
VLLLLAFKLPERSKTPSANFAPFQSKSFYLQAAEQSEFFQRGPGAPYHGPCATKAVLGNERKGHLANNVRKPAVLEQ